MIISDKFKCIYIRIPKTGSTSVEQALIANDPNCIQSDNTSPPYGHHAASAVREMAGEERWNTYFKFAFVRSPYEWFASNYSDHCRFPIEEGEYAETIWSVLEDNHKMPQLIQHSERDDVGIVTGPMALTMLSMMQFWFHGDYLPGGKYSEIVDQSSWINEELDHVARFEDFDEEWEVIAKEINFPEDYEMPKANATPQQFYQINIDPQSNGLLQAAYRRDFKRYYPQLKQ